MARISVIVPVYKVEQYLDDCVESILAQSFSDFELILVDDGSPDKSGEMCETIKEKDKRVRVIHKENGGLSSARNAGTETAAGEYIAYVDSDDIIAPDYLETLYMLAEENGADISVCSFTTFEEECVFPSGEYKTEIIDGGEACRRIVGLHERFMITACGKLYKNNLKSELVYPLGKLHEDEFVTYKAMYLSGKVAVTAAPLYGYRQRKGSIMSSDVSEQNLSALDAILSSAKWLGERGDDSLALLAEKRYVLNLGIMYYKFSKQENGKENACSLLERYKEYTNGRMRKIRSAATVEEKLALDIFKISPKLYCLMADIRIKIRGTE